MTDPRLAYDRHARSLPEQAFWEQVKRTIGGKPVTEEQIALIVDQCRGLLDFRSDESFLDLCCGNGALTARVFEGARGGVGVDISTRLIDVARGHFARPGFRYEVADVVEWAETAEIPDPAPSVALLYGSINYLSPAEVARLLGALRLRFTSLRRLVIGNVADRDRMNAFYTEKTYEPGIENRPDSAIGYWWRQGDFSDTASEAGWKTEVHRMPPGFFSAHYRYDLCLTADAP